jgi:hypothetical protein
MAGGTFNGNINVQRTYYERLENQWAFVDAAAIVLDTKTGGKVYETWHRGNWRWSKPEKDCLEDAVKFLKERHPATTPAS